MLNIEAKRTLIRPHGDLLNHNRGPRQTTAAAKTSQDVNEWFNMALYEL